MTTVNVRYMVDDVEAAVAFYTTHLGFTLISKTLPWGRVVTYGTAAILLVLGVLIVAAPDAIPGLTIPDHASTSDMAPMPGMG